MGFLSKGWKGRGISQGPALHPQWGMTRNSSYFLFSHPKRYNYRDLCGIHLIPINKNSNRHCTKLITKHLCFHHNREHSVLELAAKDAAAPRKGAGKKKKHFADLQPQSRRAAKVIRPFSRAKWTGIRRSSGQLPHTALSTHHKAFCSLNSLLPPLQKKRQN